MATDTESAAPTYQQVVASWNAQADEHNQWAELGEDEKIEWAMACAKSTPPAVVETPQAPAFYTAFGRHDGRPVAMPQYSDTSEAGVKRKVLEIAWRKGWRGTADERLRELGWQVGPVFTEPPAVVEPLTADGMKEPKNGQHWRVEWWNESCRMMLPTNKKLDCFQSFKNGTLMFTIKQAAHGIGIKKGDSHA